MFSSVKLKGYTFVGEYPLRRSSFVTAVLVRPPPPTTLAFVPGVGDESSRRSLRSEVWSTGAYP